MPWACGPCIRRIKVFLDDGGLVAVVTECLSGATSTSYSASIVRWDNRIASCANTTLPSAVAKVSVFTGNPTLIGDRDPVHIQREFKELMNQSWAGEIQEDNLSKYIANESTAKTKTFYLAKVDPDFYALQDAAISGQPQVAPGI